MNGDNSNAGTLAAPWKEIVYALAQSRARPVRTSACIYMRAGVHWFGDHRENFGLAYESQIGALSLSAVDSQLTLSAYNGEEVVFSGGVDLSSSLQWSEYKKVPAGTIMQAKLPPSVDVAWEHFNELYIDGNAAIRAKYPNGDPFTTGRSTEPTGYMSGAASWIGPDKSISPALEIHVSRPEPNSTIFPQFQIALEGTVRDFDPPHSYWGLASPPGGGGSTYVRPQGFVWNEHFSPRAANWSKPSEAMLFAYHCSSWGSWQFAIDAVLPANKTVLLGRGGYQEARGCASGSDMYVHNVLEELDAVNEWFVDRSSRTLYFLPNTTTGMPQSIVASQVPCIISVHGDRQLPVHHVTITGISFRHTPNNFLRQYEAPSGGDYSIHRGAAVFLQGVENCVVTQNRFTHLGSNALFVSNYAVNTTISYNAFRWLGESAIILAGQTDGIDGVSNKNQPTATHVEGNVAHDFSVYVKQGDAIFEAMARNSKWAGNLAYNSPRSVFNKNDGFAGGLDVYQNLLFNANKETSDHGPINTWDRQPYVTENGGHGASVVPRMNVIHNNFLINDFGSDFTVDHDDGSSFYLDSYNMNMYSGSKNYLGHSKSNDHQLFVYSDVHPGYGFPGCYQTDSGEDYDEPWTNNQCILLSTNNPYSYSYCDVQHPELFPLHANNSFYSPDGTLNITCGSAHLTLPQWQALRQDRGSTVMKTPDVDTVIGWGKEVVFVKNGYGLQEGEQVSW